MSVLEVVLDRLVAKRSSYRYESKLVKNVKKCLIMLILCIYLPSYSSLEFLSETGPKPKLSLPSTSPGVKNDVTYTKG